MVQGGAKVQRWLGCSRHCRFSTEALWQGEGWGGRRPAPGCSKDDEEEEEDYLDNNDDVFKVREEARELAIKFGEEEDVEARETLVKTSNYHRLVKVIHKTWYRELDSDYQRAGGVNKRTSLPENLAYTSSPRQARIAFIFFITIFIIVLYYMNRNWCANSALHRKGNFPILSNLPLKVHNIAQSMQCGIEKKHIEPI